MVAMFMPIVAVGLKGFWKDLRDLLTHGRVKLLLATHQLEVGNLLQLGNDELSMHVIHFHLQGMDLHFIFLDLVFHVKSVGEGRDGELVVLLDKSFQGSLVHTGHVLDLPYLLFYNIGNTHDEKDSIWELGKEWSHRELIVH